MKTLKKFSTLKDAIDAGYSIPKFAEDTSGPNKYGYDYTREDGVKSVDVYLVDEFNKIGKRGAVKAMYPPK